MVFSGKSTVSAAGVTRSRSPPAAARASRPRRSPARSRSSFRRLACLRPADGEELEQGAPQFSWTAVPGAARYTVEVCRDRDCGAVVARDPAVAASPLELAVEGGLPAGELFWRVTAVAAVRSRRLSEHRRPGPGRGGREAQSADPRAADGSRSKPWSRGAASRRCPEPVVRALDRRGAELPWTLQVDGRETGLEAFRALPLAGRHEIAARATDARGRSADSPAIAIHARRRRALGRPRDDGRAVRSRSPKRSVAERPQPGAPARSKSAPAPVAACDSGLEVMAAGGGAGCRSPARSLPPGGSGDRRARSRAARRDPAHDRQRRRPG